MPDDTLDDETADDLFVIGHLADREAAAALAALVRRGFPVELFKGEIEPDGLPVFGGQMGFGNKAVLAAMAGLSFAKDEVASLDDFGHVVTVDAVSVSFEFRDGCDFDGLAPKLDLLASALDASLVKAAAEAQADIMALRRAKARTTARLH